MLTKIGGFFIRIMDGSLFFRGVSGLLDFLGRLCAGSFIAGLFTADYNEEKFKESRFVIILDRLLNGVPKYGPPAAWPGGLSRVCTGSLLLNAACGALDTPVPRPGISKGNPRGFAPAFLPALWPVIRWVGFALPIWGLLFITIGAPFLPTMTLAGMLASVLFFAVLSRRFVIDPTAVFLILFVIITLLAGFTSFVPSSSISIALLTSVLMFSYMAALACCRQRKTMDIFFFAFAAAAAVTGLLGLYQVFMKIVDMTWVDQTLHAELQFRAYASFGNPNVYGTYLLLAIPLCIALFFYVKKPLYKLIVFGISGLLLVNLLLTYSRGCYLALALALAVFILLMEKRLLVFLSAGVFALPFMLPPSVLNRLLSITNFEDTSTTFRLYIWQGSLRILRDFWMTGLGQGNEAYNAVYPYYAFNAVVSPHSHNLFLQIFVETGIIGITAFIGMLAWFFRTQAGFLRRTADFRLKVISASMTAAVIGFLFQGIFDYVFYNYRVMLIFFIFMGLGNAFARSSAGKTHD